MVEGVLGLINRFAQQLNVFSLSQSLKAVARHLDHLVQLAPGSTAAGRPAVARRVALRSLARAVRARLSDVATRDDAGDKTEKPTPKKLEDARKKGDVSKSKEVTSTVVLVVWLASAR
jgi:SpoVK/Ycf46/Vps4 family AAA+-type ATPase